jgi:pilus assembly protein CpaB
MRAKTILAILFLISLGAAAIVFIRALPPSAATTESVRTEEILVATSSLAAGTLLRTHDVAWQTVPGTPQPGDIVRPSAAAREAQPEIDEGARALVSGAALRAPVKAGDPIHRESIVKPGDRDFLQVVLAPGARAIAIPVALGGASTGLLYPGDRVDVILTQKFNDTAAPLTRRSVSETVVENLRVLVIDPLDAKAASGNTFGRTVTLEVIPEQAEKISVAAELGKLSLTLRSVATADGVAAASTTGPGQASGIKATWAGDVSPALGGTIPADKVLTAERPPVEVIRGSRRVEFVKPQ